MNETQNKYQPSRLGRFIRWLFRRQTQGRALIGLAAFATLVAGFYLEEDWRGWHAWQKCKSGFEARGFVLDWDKLIPPPVPDDANFFKAPKMAEWFVKHNTSTTTELDAIVTNTDKTAVITDKAMAVKFLAWSDQFQSDFEMMREALKRPDARIDGDYSDPAQIPFPNFTNIRAVTQVLEQRAKCHFLLNQPEQALSDLTLMHDMCRPLEGAPTGKPMTPVAALFNASVTGHYVDTIADGMQQHVWQEPQLVALQKQLAGENLTTLVFSALQDELAHMCREFEIAPLYKFSDFHHSPRWSDKFGSMLWLLWPRGWTYQNMVNVAVLELKPLNGFDSVHDTISPRVFDQNARDFDNIHRHISPYNRLAAIVTPNFSKAWQGTAHNQTMVNEVQIVCALERYRLTHGEYPETLDALLPLFIEKLPHDIIGGQPLHYRRAADGKFLLYSVGWNETDDGGQESPPNQNGGVDFTKGDWVWQYPAR